MALVKQGREILSRYRPLVDAEFACMLGGRGRVTLYEMIRYHLGFADAVDDSHRGSGGKRVRAALCLLACEAAGGTAETAAPAAAAIELCHSFTLMHDDIADQDEVRRRKETVWRRWGVGRALTAGDALFALANLTMARLSGIPADIVCEVTRELNEATLLVCEGQESDLSYEGRTDIQVEDYLAMVERKTAALIAAAAAIGAQIAGAPQSACEGLRAFGRHLGIAYQIADDVLGIWGDPARMGKPVGSDLRRNKRSLPVVHALTAAAEAGDGDLAARLARGADTNEEAAEIAGRMAGLGSRSFCER
ncbi:MAG: polyprenyl synthetase family protein, partial [Armatimonadetes bacterium]|nr:polyprenyl synthetase family protein [Armatimonadota bacterium]